MILAPTVKACGEAPGCAEHEVRQLPGPGDTTTNFLILNRLECASNLSALDHFLNCDLSRFMQVYCTHVHTIYNIRIHQMYIHSRYVCNHSMR